jgi:methionine-S-sulfoxide reductase
MNRNIRAFVILTLVLAVAGVALAGGSGESKAASGSAGTTQTGPAGEPRMSAPVVDAPDGAMTAVFASGCFWCMEEAFEKFDGVYEAVSGYSGGTTENPTYQEVSYGNTGHAEVVQVIYDPEKLSYEDLLYIFWRNVDLLDGGGQFCDRGPSYRPGIFYGSEEERELAEQSLEEIEDSGRFNREIAVEITPLEAFWIAEDYHQDYYQTNEIRYKLYKDACGRVRRLEQLWGDEALGVQLDG